MNKPLQDVLTQAATFLGPYEFSPTVLLLCVGALLLYARGVSRQRRKGTAPGIGRITAFVTGTVLIYAVLQTRFDYYAQHMFFIHRIQHLVLHHIGPFLVALAAPQEAIAAGIPDRLLHAFVRPLWRAAGIQYAYRLIQQPIVAATVFVGLIYLWLYPPLHFYAMLSVPLYDAMNWGMALDGLLFWWLMLNPRPSGSSATIGYGQRIVVLFLVMPPQIIIGAYIALSHSDLYSIYALCGRLWPLSPTVDQQLGGLITWIPAAMMSVLGILIVLRWWMVNEPSRAAASQAACEHMSR